MFGHFLIVLKAIFKKADFDQITGPTKSETMRKNGLNFTSEGAGYVKALLALGGKEILGFDLMHALPLQAVVGGFKGARRPLP